MTNAISAEVDWNPEQARVWIAFRSDTVLNDLGRPGQYFEYLNSRDTWVSQGWDKYERTENNDRREFLSALKRGELVACGQLNGRGDPVPVPTDFWETGKLSAIRPDEARSRGRLFTRVRLKSADVRKIWSQPKNRRGSSRGRNPKYDWPACFRYLDSLFEEHGELSSDDVVWSRIGHVVNAAMHFFNERDKYPSRSTVYEQIAKYLKNRI